MFEFTRKLIPTKSQFVVIMCLLRGKPVPTTRGVGNHCQCFDYKFFIMFLPNSEGRHFFLLC